MVSVNSIRNEAWRKFKDVTRTSDEWKAFVLASAYSYKYDLEDRLQLYRYNSTGKAFADVEIWNRAFKRRVDSTAQAIPLVTVDNEIKYVFEREHTTGRNPVQLYELTNSGKMALSNLIELPNSSNIPFEEIVFNHVFREVKMIAENQFNNDNLFYDKERYTRLIANTTALATLERLDLNTGVYSPDFGYISEIDYSDAQKGINIAYKYIDELITSIKLEEKEIEQGVEYENRSSTLARNVGERTPQVSNESQAESIQGKNSRRETELPGVSGRDSGRSRHAGHNANESEEREVWSDPRTTEQRLHEVRSDNEQNSQRESRDNQTTDNISRDGEIKNQEAVDPDLNKDGETASFASNTTLTSEENDNKPKKSIYHMTEDEIIKGMPEVALPKDNNLEFPPNSILHNILFSDRHSDYDLYGHIDTMFADIPEIVSDELPDVMTNEEKVFIVDLVTTALLNKLEMDTPKIKYENINPRNVPGFSFLAQGMFNEIANKTNEIYNKIGKDEKEIIRPAFESYENNDGKLRFRDSLVDKDLNISGADIQKAFSKEETELSTVINDVINKNIYNSTIDGFTDESQEYIRSVIGSSIYLSLNDATGDGSDYLRPGFESIDPVVAGYIEDMVASVHDEIKTDILNSVEKWRLENEHTRAEDEEITSSEAQELDKETSIDEPIGDNSESEASTHQTEVETSNTHQIAMDIPSLDDISNNIDSLDEKVDNVSITEFKSSDLNDLDRINELEKDVIKSLNEVIEIEQEANKVEMQLSEFYLKPSLIGSKKTPPNEYAYKATERVANREVRKFARHLASTLGYEVDDSKTGVNYDHGTMVLWKPDSDFGIYLSVDFNRIPTSIAPYHDEYELKDKILYRATNKKNWATGYTNNYINIENGLKVSDLYEKIPPLVDKQEEKSKSEKLQQEAVSMVNSSFYVIDENNEIIENQFVVSVDSVDREFLIYDKNKSIEDREYRLPFTYLNDINKVNEDGSRIIAVKDHSFNEIESMLDEYDEWKENNNAKIENSQENVIKDEVNDVQNELVAIGVGTEFILTNKEDVMHIESRASDQIVNVQGKAYALLRGATFEDSTKIDNLIDSDKYDIYKVNEYLIDVNERDTVNNTIAMSFDRNDNSYLLGNEENYRHIMKNKSNIHIEHDGEILPIYTGSSHHDSLEIKGYMNALPENTYSLSENIKHIVPVTDKEYEQAFKEYEGLAMSVKSGDDVLDVEEYSEPIVWIKWSENPLINELIPKEPNGIKMSYPLANKMLQRLNDVQHIQRNLDGYGYYDKTRIEIKAFKDDAVYMYGERFDIGDGDFDLHDFVKMGVDYRIENKGENQELYNEIKNNMLPILENRELSPEEQKYYDDFNLKVMEYYNLDPSLEKLRETYNDFTAYEFQAGPVTFSKFVPNMPLGIAYTDGIGENENYEIQVSFDVENGLKLIELTSEDVRIKQEIPMSVSEMIYELENYTFSEFVNNGASFEKMEVIDYLVDMSKTDDPRAKSLIESYTKEHGAKFIFPNGDVIGMLDSEKPHIDEKRTIAVGDGVNSYTLVSLEDLKELEIDLNRSNERVVIEGKRHILAKPNSSEDQAKVDKLFEKYGWNEIPKPNKDTQEHLKIEDYGLVGMPVTFQGEDYIIGVSSHTSDGISYLNLNSKDNLGVTSVMYSDIRPVSGVTADSNILSQFRNSEEATIDDVKKQDVSEISNTEFNNDGNVSNFTIENENLGNYTPKERYQKNIEAIELLRDLDSDNRPATHEEKVVLSEFTGFGGIPQVFDETDASWAKEHDELKSLISDSEYLSARASVLNAHYTSPIVIEEMYNTISKMGITQGRALEPAVGTGNFLGMLPNEMNMKFTGVELDELTGRIAKNIYDDSEIIIGGFEDYRASDNTFDLAVGNVPFGNYQLNDTRYDKHKFFIHDYFFAKTLDKVKPNGVIAFITSSGTMDKQNPKVREYLAERADLLGAVRLPNTAFKDNANTEVTADILFFQKREYLRNINVDRPIWVDTSKVNGHDLNRHFIQNEKAIVGDLKEISGRFGPELACVLDEKSRYKELLSQAMSTVNTNILLPETSFEHQNEVLNNVVAPANLRPFSYFVQDGELYFKKESSFDVEHINEQGKKRERIEAMIELRDDLRQLIDMQTGDYSDAEIKEFQNTFSEKYDNFVKDNGRISKVKDENGKLSVANSIAFSRDVSFPLLQSLENIKDDMFESKADIFTKRTISKHIAPTYASNGYEALSISLNEKGYVDLDYMSELTDKPKLELVKELDGVIFRDNKETIAKSGSGVDNFHNLENGVYVTADEFLSGNIREKLEVERAIYNNYSDAYTNEVKNDIEKNIQALEEVMPEPLTATEISVSMQAPWIPPSDVQAFAKELLDEYYDYFEIEKCELNGKYNISNKRSAYGVLATKTYGTDRMNALEIIEDTLNSKSCEVRDREEYGDSQVRYVINQEETLLAQQKQDLIKEKFESWIWKDINRRERLEKSYNEMFNSSVARHYDGDHLEFPEMSTEITLGKHQKDAVARGLYGGNSLIAHCVGAGKTFTMTAIAMESKRIGIANKSMMVVPNHLTEQWGNDILKLYPNANILVATKDDFTPAKRQEFISKIAVGNYDAIVIGHSQFNKIPLSKERQELVMRNEIKEITDQIREVKASEGKNFTVKQLETRKNQLETKLTHLLNAEWKDDVIDFESLGVDRLFVDESDIFKNLDTYTQMRNVAGLNSKGSLQAFDMYAKVQYMNEITNNKGTFYATGTPISNSIVEMYTNQRTLQPDRLKELGINNFDQWASVFTNVTTSLELKPEGGGYQLKNRLSGYKNVPELKTIFNEIADIKTKDMLKLDEPEVEYITVVSERSDFQGEFIESLGERADQVRAKLVAPEVDNMLKITSDGRDLALDQRMINPMLPDVEGSKVNMCVDNIFNLWEETKEKKSTQLIFSDISTPSTKKNEERYCVYDDIKYKLIQKGIPENEIKFIHDATTDKQRDDLFEAVRKGEIRVLLGSTPKMGAGTNVQKLLYACHHLDCPWRPRDMEQREGRIIRQGNENEKVKIFRYVTKDTFDTYNYQLIEAKQKFISTIMTSDSPLRKIDDLDDMVLNYATVKAITVGDPYIKEKMELDIDLTKLKTMKASFMSNKYEMESNIQKHYPQQITRFENMIKNTEDDLETFKNNNQIDAEGKSIFSSMVIDGKEYKDKSEAGEVFKKVIPKCTVRSPKKIASYKGFDIAISFNDYFKNYMCHIIGKESYEFELGTNASGNMQRLENAFSKIEQKYKTAKTRLEDIKHNLAKAKEEVGKEFPHEKELADKIKRLKEVESAINNRSKTNNKNIEPGFAI